MYTATAPEAKTADRAKQVIWYLLSFVELLLALRFVLKLLGAGQGNWFSNFVYSSSGVVVAPFFRVISNTQVLGGTFEYATLLAMFVIFLGAAVISVLFRSIPGKR